MKRLIGQIILFVLSITFFSCIYIGVFKMSVTAVCILLAILALYALCMGIGERGMRELRKYEQKLIHFGLDEKDGRKILLFSLLTLCPAWFCYTDFKYPNKNGVGVKSVILRKITVTFDE